MMESFAESGIQTERRGSVFLSETSVCSAEFQESLRPDALF